MPIISFGFIAYLFATALLYFAVPKKARWCALLVASYVFFWINSEWLVVTLFIQTLATFLIGLWIQHIENRQAPRIAQLTADKKREEAKELKTRTRSQKRYVMALGIIVNLGALVTLKYFNFFAGNANVLLVNFGIELPEMSLIVPIGISFYSLQGMAYLIDLRRSKMTADRNLFKFMLFMSYFPQIIQGPIARHHQLAKQLYKGHAFDYKRLCYGAQLMLWGFMKKLILADRLAIPVNQIFDHWAYYDGLLVFLAGAAYGLQVYADFSGGIDIVRGFSQILGIELEQNFRQPYFSKSITDLWRRWHITLGAWMRDYVFYPLSMSKALTKFGKVSGKLVGAQLGRRLAPCLATFVAFLAVGLWHGPEWTFVAYGIWNGIFLSLAIVLPEFYAFLKRKLKINESSGSWLFFQMFRTFIITAISRFFPRSENLDQCFDMLGSIAHNWYDLSFLTDGTLINLGLDFANWLLVLTMIIILFGVGVAHERNLSLRDMIARQGFAARWLIYIIALCAVIVFGIYGSGYDAAAFIYQQY